MATISGNIVGDIIYILCFLSLVIYIIVTLSVSVRKICSFYALSYILACNIWLNLTLFYAWFFVPTIIRHGRALYLSLPPAEEYDFHYFFETTCTVLTSDASADIFWMVLGWFASAFSISSSLAQWQVDGCSVTTAGTDCHGRLSTWVIKAALRLEEFAGISDRLDGPPIILLPFTCQDLLLAGTTRNHHHHQHQHNSNNNKNKKGKERHRRHHGSCFFSFPRWIHVRNPFAQGWYADREEALYEEERMRRRTERYLDDCGGGGEDYNDVKTHVFEMDTYERDVGRMEYKLGDLVACEEGGRWLLGYGDDMAMIKLGGEKKKGEE